MPAAKNKGEVKSNLLSIAILHYENIITQKNLRRNKLEKISQIASDFSYLFMHDMDYPACLYMRSFSLECPKVDLDLVLPKFPVYDASRSKG